MISLLFIPCGDADKFAAQVKIIRETVDYAYELVVALIETDPESLRLEEVCVAEKARYLVLPDFGYTTIVNILAARARGEYVVYVPPNMEIEEEGWGKEAVSQLQFPDKICGGILNKGTDYSHCSGLIMPLKTMHILGYYSMPLFETMVFGMRWTASVLTDLERFVTMDVNIRHVPIAKSSYYTQDNDLFNVTRQGRQLAYTKLLAFTEEEDDEGNPISNR